MFEWIKNKADKKKADAQTENLPKEHSQLSTSIEKNIAMLEKLFQDVDIMLSRQFQNENNPDLKFCIFFSDGVTDSMMVNEHVIKPLILNDSMKKNESVFEQVKMQIVMINDVKETVDVDEIISAITYGDTLLLVDGSDKALLLSSKSFELRGISEPEGEKALSGPREGFTEGIMTNLSQIRRRLRTNELKLHFTEIGKQSKTAVCVAYMDNIVNKKILKELYRRLDKIDMDGILDSNYLAEHIAEKSFLGLNTTGATERPDVVVSKLLEGRIAILTDGTPVVLTVPYLFIENFQSNEDYYMNPIYTSYGRWIRILCFILTITVPAMYIAIVGYHHEILPSSLMRNFATGRKSVPLPAALECFIMLVVFDILREAGVRIPGHVGSALSIVGALVIGQSAVEAKLVAPSMVIIVAIAGITILMVPRLFTTSLAARYLCLTLATMLGLTGVLVGVSLLIIHLLNLHSFGVPIFTPTADLGFQEVKDTFIRAPWPKMLTRTRPMTKRNTVRQKEYTPDKDQSQP